MPGSSSWQKQELSLAFAHALATQAEATIAHWNVDKDGVDLTLRHGPVMVDFQMKCTSSPRPSGDGYSYPLDAVNYDRLRDPCRSAPGYLILVVTVPEARDWIVHEPDHVLLTCHGYWAQLQDRTDPPQGKTKSIMLPHKQVLNAAALDEMFAFSRSRIRGVA